jgi:hypothetical protein
MVWMQGAFERLRRRMRGNTPHKEAKNATKQTNRFQ